MVFSDFSFLFYDSCQEDKILRLKCVSERSWKILIFLLEEKAVKCKYEVVVMTASCTCFKVVPGNYALEQEGMSWGPVQGWNSLSSPKWRRKKEYLCASVFGVFGNKLHLCLCTIKVTL